MGQWKSFPFQKKQKCGGWKGRMFPPRKKRTLRSSLSLPDDIVWETTLSSKTSSLSLPLTSILFPASHCLLFLFALLFLLFLFQTAFGTLQTGGSSCPIVSFERDEEINPSLFLSLSPSPSLFLSLPLRLSLHPLPPWQSTPAWSWLQASTQRSALGLPCCSSAPALSGFVGVHLYASRTRR